MTNTPAGPDLRNRDTRLENTAAFRGQDTDSLATPDENETAAAALLEQARLSLVLYSYDLEPRIYDRTRFVDGITQMILRNTRCRIRILIENSDGLVKNGHRLIHLARRFDSFIKVRQPDPSYSTTNSSFLVVDETGFLMREISGRYDGIWSPQAPLQARRLLNFFDKAWDHSILNPELRRLVI